MRARAKARLLVVAVAAALAAGAAAQPRLVPPRDADNPVSAAYRADVRRVFAEAFGAGVKLRAIVQPGLGIEFAVGLRQQGNRYEIFSLTPSDQIWAYQRLAMLRSGEMGAMIMEGGDEAGEEDMFSGELRDVSEEEIRRLEEELPDDPTELPLTRCAAAVDGDAAAPLLAAWQAMLEDVRPGDALEAGADGTTYLFSMEAGGRTLSGETWTPEPGTRTEMLARLAETMRDHCANPRDETLRALAALARALGRR